jgi:hypothetical protein
MTARKPGRARSGKSLPVVLLAIGDLHKSNE